MKVTFEVNMKGEAAKAEGFIQQVSNHLIDYINQNNFTVVSIDRKIAFDEEEQNIMQPLSKPEETAQIIDNMPMNAVGEKLKKLKEFYKITKKEAMTTSPNGKLKIGDNVKCDVPGGKGKIVNISQDWIRVRDSEGATHDFDEDDLQLI